MDFGLRFWIGLGLGLRNMVVAGMTRSGNLHGSIEPPLLHERGLREVEGRVPGEVMGGHLVQLNGSASLDGPHGNEILCKLHLSNGLGAQRHVLRHGMVREP